MVLVLAFWLLWSEYHSKMVSVSEALRKWDKLAPSVLDIYYVFILCNNIDWCMNVRNWNKLLQNKIIKRFFFSNFSELPICGPLAALSIKWFPAYHPSNPSQNIWFSKRLKSSSTRFTKALMKMPKTLSKNYLS